MAQHLVKTAFYDKETKATRKANTVFNCDDPDRIADLIQKNVLEKNPFKGKAPVAADAEEKEDDETGAAGEGGDEAAKAAEAEAADKKAAKEKEAADKKAAKEAEKKNKTGKAGK